MDTWQLIADPDRDDIAHKLTEQEHAFLAFGDVLFEFRSRVVDGRGFGREEMLYETALEEYGMLGHGKGTEEHWRELGYSAVLAVKRYDDPITVKILLELQYDDAPDAVNYLGCRRVVQDVLTEARRRLGERGISTRD